MRTNIRSLPASVRQQATTAQAVGQDAARRRVKGLRESPLVLSMRGQIELAGLPEPVLEHRFDKVRRFRFDMCWPDKMIAVEVEGGQHLAGGGRHQRSKGYENDCVKYNLAQSLGWTVYRATTDMVKDGRALEMLRRALRQDAATDGD